METFKAYLLIVGFVGILGFGGFWAVSSLQDPVRVTSDEEIRVVAQTPVSSVTEPVVEKPVAVSETPSTPNEASETPAGGEHGALISALQKLITDNILMKEGSRGTRVGTVQQFLNIYNNTSSTVDNDYGPGTKTKVAAFQKAVGLNADGQAGPNTYKKMIDWLNAN